MQESKIVRNAAASTRTGRLSLKRCNANLLVGVTEPSRLAPKDGVPLKIDIRFTAPEHGWITLHLAGPAGEAAINFSDVPNDALAQLCADLGLLFTGAQVVQTPFSLEPGFAEVEVARQPDASYSVFVIYPGPSPQAIHLGVPLRVLAQAFWRALRRLQTQFSDDDRQHWSWPFPAAQLERLGVNLTQS